MDKKQNNPQQELKKQKLNRKRLSSFSKEDFQLFLLQQGPIKPSSEDIYCSHYFGMICNPDEDIDAGMVEFSIIHVDQAIEDAIDLKDLTIDDMFLSQFGNAVLDYGNKGLHKNLKGLNPIKAKNNDLLIIHRLELLPEYRGHEIGSKTITVIQKKFSNSCGYFLVRPTAIQFQQNVEFFDKEWLDDLAIKELPADEELSNYKIMSFWSKLSFQPLSKKAKIFVYQPFIHKMKSVPN